MEKVRLFDIEINNLSLNETAEKVFQLTDEKRFSSEFIVTPNAQHIVNLHKDTSFKECYKNAYLKVADGVPLLWLAKIKRSPLKERVNGTDLFDTICRKSVHRNSSIFLCGGRPGAAEKCRDILFKKYPGINICGTYCPPFGFEVDAFENQKCIDVINQSSPDILFIGLGSPKQEKWFFNNRSMIKTSVAICTGVSFELIAGVVKRAPLWMQRNGLEWFYRFTREPKRLFKRYTLENAEFVVLAFKDLLLQKRFSIQG